MNILKKYVYKRNKRYYDLLNEINNSIVFIDDDPFYKEMNWSLKSIKSLLTLVDVLAFILIIVEIYIKYFK